MRGFFFGLAILLLLVTAVGVWTKGLYDGLVGASEGVKANWAQVEDPLQRRYELVPDLVRTMQGYTPEEHVTLQSVNDARARVGQARSVEEKIEASELLDAAIARLRSVGDQYPDLKSNLSFIRLHGELSGTEERIARLGDQYNESVVAYNTRLASFPATLLAGVLGFEPAVPFRSSVNHSARPDETAADGGN